MQMTRGAQTARPRQLTAGRPAGPRLQTPAPAAALTLPHGLSCPSPAPPTLPPTRLLQPLPPEPRGVVLPSSSHTLDSHVCALVTFPGGVAPAAERETVFGGVGW